MRPKYRYRENKYRYGRYLEVNLYPVFETPRPSRRARYNPTRPVQERLNQVHAERELSRLIPANFTEDDLNLTLTFRPENNPETLKDARREFRNFIARYDRARTKLGLPRTRYIYSLEQGTRTGRIHIHVILTGGLLPRDIQRIWGRGYVDKCRPLMFDDTGIQGLAKYFCKQKISDKGERHAKRYQCSRSCIHPQPKNNDHKYSKRRVLSLAQSPEDRRTPEKYYPGFTCTDIREFYNDIDGFVYLTMYFIEGG